MAEDRPDSNVGRSAAPFGPFVRGLIAAVALGSLMSGGGGALGEAVPLAAGMGLLAAVFASTGWLNTVSNVFYSALGLIASVPTVVHFVQPVGCSGGLSVGFRYAAVSLLVLIAVVSAFASVLFRGRPFGSLSGLALYGALETLVAGASFLADPHNSGDWVATAALVPAAALLGWFVIVAPDVVLGVCGVVFGMQAIYGASLGSGCSAANFSGAGLVVMYCISYLVCRAVAGRWFTRRS